MFIWAGLKRLNFKQLLRLSGAFIVKPRYLIPSYKATKETLIICNNLFGNQHHGNNRTNAFRHALWNYKICQRCLKVAGSPEKSVAWAKKITDLHEELLQNNELDKGMDLQNNKIGRDLFRKQTDTNLDVIPLLREMMTNAEKVSNIRELEKSKDKLVFTES